MKNCPPPATRATLAAAVDPDDRDNNPSPNPHLADILGPGLRRRHLLKGGVGALTAAAFGSIGPAACGGGGGDDDPAAPAPPPAVDKTLGFTAVAKDLADQVVVPAGYTATVIYATGDTIDPAVGDYRNDGSDANFARRSGDHHDGMHWFGLGTDGRSRDASATTVRSCASTTRTSPAR